jgi:hypothetical protein
MNNELEFSNGQSSQHQPSEPVSAETGGEEENSKLAGFVPIRTGRGLRSQPRSGR